MAQHETEADTRAERIDPVLTAAGWGVVEGSQIRREMICPGRIMAGGKRSGHLSCDYVLIHKGQKLAVIEAKRAAKSHRDGVGQAKDYALRLQTRFAYATNGIKWRAIDMASPSEGDVDLPFPTPDELWERTFADHLDWRERFGEVPFETDGGKWQPRYYQHNAINAALEAISNGKKRILLTLATGTGKTSIAFQIAWKLFQSKWNLTGEATRRPRVLFLADRNILADQAYNAFSAFQADAVARIDPGLIKKKDGVPKNASIFVTIFQTFMTGDDEPVFYDYPPDFFDFIVIDECHRGGAKDESEWRHILEYFSPAVQMGMTATPKRQHNADTYSYFDEPVYTYALKDGIEDGFLTPFKVRELASSMDKYVYKPGDTVIAGEIEPGKTYTEHDFNTKIIIEERERSRVEKFMSEMDQSQKTLVFCATQVHAALVRDLINETAEKPDPNYCHRVTADEGPIGDQHLREFQDNAKTLPTILTTSQKLSTGVDALNIRHIVLMRPVTNMIEFKQIIGRGTRVYEGKDFFTIWDFVKAHENFNDPDWDGEPEEPATPEPRPTPPPTPTPPTPPDGPPEKIIVELDDGREREIVYIATTTYWSADGRPISAAEFLKRLFGDLSTLITNEDELRKIWSNPENREHFFTQLLELGYDDDRLDDIRHLIDAPDSDLYDVLKYILFTSEPKTRHDRAERVIDQEIDGYRDEMREFLINILRAYEEEGVRELAPRKLTQFMVARYGSVGEGKSKLGGLTDIKSAYEQVQVGLYLD